MFCTGRVVCVCVIVLPYSTVQDACAQLNKQQRRLDKKVSPPLGVVHALLANQH